MGRYFFALIGRKNKRIYPRKKVDELKPKMEPQSHGGHGEKLIFIGYPLCSQSLSGKPLFCG